MVDDAAEQLGFIAVHVQHDMTKMTPLCSPSGPILLIAGTIMISTKIKSILCLPLEYVVGTNPL